MSGSRPAGDEPPTDLTTVTRDDLLLDALGRGDEPPAGDGLAALLAAWRTEIGTTDPGNAVDPGTSAEPDENAESERVLHRTGAPPAAVPVGRQPRRAARFRTGDRILRLAAALLAVVGLGAGLMIGSGQAGPTSPLWSLTKVLHPHQAEIRAAEYAIDRARAAVTDGRLDEARRLVDEAREYLANITDPGAAARLRAELDAVLADLAALAPPGSPPPGVPARTPTPAGSVGTGGPATPGPAPAPGTSPGAAPENPPAPGPTTEPSTIPLPPLPTLPPVPVPSVLDPLLPGLPLPTGLPLG